MAREDSTVTTTALIGLQGQLDTVRSEIFTTNTNLQSIGRLIQTDSAEDQRRLFEERERERILLERRIRSSQEDALQQKVSASLIPPVVKLEKKLNSTFSRITAALTSLFGFFGTKIIKGIQSSARLGLGALKGIGDILKGSFGFIISTLSTISRGFTSVLSGITGITGKVLRALATLAASPFKAIADLVGKLLPGLRGGAAAAAVARPAAAVAGGIGSGLLGLLGIGSRISTGAAAIKNLQEGDPAEAAVQAAATFLPTPVPAMALSALNLSGVNLDLTSGLSNLNIGESINNFSTNNPFSNFSENLGNLTQSFPKNLSGFMSGFSGFLGFSIDSTKNQDTSAKPTSSSMSSGVNFDAPAQQAQVPVQPGNTASVTPSTLNSVSITPYNGDIQSPAEQKPSIGTIPEPKPDLIYLTSGKGQQESAISGNIPTLTDVPLIPSANPDNFYAVYAQLNYNVVL